MKVIEIVHGHVRDGDGDGDGGGHGHGLEWSDSGHESVMTIENQARNGRKRVQ